jgi:hypothetical protein
MTHSHIEMDFSFNFNHSCGAYRDVKLILIDHLKLCFSSINASIKNVYEVEDLSFRMQRSSGNDFDESYEFRDA